tara:strand:+ start:504 stop:776 length:273 start_codon:yes stop_codon:yes gene_type:complete
MATPYKMKGSPMQRNFGIGSPLHDEKEKEKSEDKRTTARKVWDKATQIGEGFKQSLYADSDYRGGGTNIIDSFKKGYKREKKADEAAAGI